MFPVFQELSSFSAYPRSTGRTSVDNSTGGRVFVDLEVISQASQKDKEHLSEMLVLSLSGVTEALMLFYITNGGTYEQPKIQTCCFKIKW